jgi:hypothetical protein
MKLNLLLATSLITGAAFGQFTDANKPTMGTSVTMYVMDSNTVDFAAMTGSGQTWDYSTTPGIYGETRDVSVVTPTAAGYATEYPSSTFAIQIPQFVTSFYTSSSTTRNSQGFVFDGGTFGGTVIVKLNTNDQLLMNYPYDLGSTPIASDPFSGSANVMGTDYPTTGTVSTSVDGSGTLKLNAATTLTGVLRYKSHDVATVTIPLIGTITMDRTQYEYYHHATSNLPVFVHAKLVINLAGTPTTQNIAMSSVAPDEYLNVAENDKIAFGIYPNPANESVVISGLTGNETISIVDMAGRTVLTTQNTGASQTLNVADFQAGVYNVIVSANGIKSTKKLTIN